MCLFTEDDLVIFYGKILWNLGLVQMYSTETYIEGTLIANNKFFIVHMKYLAKCCSRNMGFY